MLEPMVYKADITWTRLHTVQIPYKIRTGFEAHGEQPKVDLCWSSALLNGGPCGAAPQWSSARKAAAYGKSMQDQLGKDSIPWEGPTQSSGREWPWKVAEMKGYGLTAASIQHSTVQFVRGLPVLIWSHKLLFHRIFSSSSFKDIDLEQHGYA